MKQNPTKSVADTRSEIVNNDALSFCCPTPESPVWNVHPRVYLPLAAEGCVTCPYCGTEYILKI